MERHAAAQSQKADVEGSPEPVFDRPYQVAVAGVAVEVEVPSAVGMAVEFLEQTLSMDGASWAAVHMENASGRETDSTFAEA